MATIGELITGKQATAAAKAKAAATDAAAKAAATDAVAKSTADLGTTGAADDLATAVLARGLKFTGPVLVLGTPNLEYDSRDGQVVNVTALGSVDTVVPDDAPPPAPNATAGP